LVFSQSCSVLRSVVSRKLSIIVLMLSFSFGDFAARVDLDRAGQIALRHRGCDFGDGAHLGRQISRQQVDVAGQVLPGAGRAGHVGLATEAAFDPDLARHRGDLIGEVANVLVMLLMVSASAATSPID